jgi:hypothetical protein
MRTLVVLLQITALRADLDDLTYAAVDEYEYLRQEHCAYHFDDALDPCISKAISNSLSDAIEIPLEGLVLSVTHRLAAVINKSWGCDQQPANASCVQAAYHQWAEGSVAAHFCKESQEQERITPQQLREQVPVLSRRRFGEGSGPHFLHALYGILQPHSQQHVQESSLRTHAHMAWHDGSLGFVSLAYFPGHRTILDTVVATALAASSEGDDDFVVCNIGVASGALFTAAALAASARHAGTSSQDTLLLTAQVGELLLSGNIYGGSSGVGPYAR